MAKVWDDIDKEGKDFSLKLGNKTISLSNEEGERWKKAVQPVLDDYVKMTKEQGLPGDEVLKFALDYIKEKSEVDEEVEIGFCLTSDPDLRVRKRKRIMYENHSSACLNPDERGY